MSDEPKSESLDPEDWEEMRALAHRAVDEAIEYLRTVRDRPAWRPVPGDVAEKFRQPLPLEPRGADQTYEDFVENILPYPMGNIHPRFWSWYMGNGTFTGALGDFLAAVMNPNMGGGNHVANLVEAQVIDWFKEIAGFPREASGLLVSGGSMANLVGLAVARNAKAGFDVRAEGLRASAKQMVLYSSSEVHSCHPKAVELLGLGNAALRKIPVNSEYEINLGDLERAIARDREDGFLPICVIGNAGTVNTGAIDDLKALAGLCEKERLWYHIDGAIGGVVGLAEKHGHLVAGLRRADSVALDIHKWMHVPFEAGCVLVRDEEAHRRTFAITPEYLEHAARGLSSGAKWFSEYGPQLSRGFRALKVWFAITEHGARKYGRLIDQNIEQAQRLADAIRSAAALELMAPVPLNIVCFRFNPGGLDDDQLNALNAELLMRMHEGGKAIVSNTTLGGKYCLRAALCNHRSREEDFGILIEEVKRIGGELAACS